MSEKKPLIFVSSPYRSGTFIGRETNIVLAKQICRAVVEAGGVPFAPHLLYPGFLDDGDPSERSDGIECGLEVLSRCDGMIEVTRDGQLSQGQTVEHNAAIDAGVEIRSVEDLWHTRWDREVGLLVSYCQFKLAEAAKKEDADEA